MPKKEDLLQGKFLEQFSSYEELDSFLKQLQNRGIEKLLEGELDHHLSHERHQKSADGNYRNGRSKKQIKTAYGESNIEVPRDRNSSFQPQLIPKRSRLTEGIENVIISMYAKGMSNADIEAQIQEIYGFELSTSAISTITDKINGDTIHPDHWTTCI